MARPLVTTAGRRVPGTEPFPESAREEARALGLVDEATILRYTQTNQAGAISATYPPDPEPVRARLDPTSGGMSGLRGGTLVEETTHYITFDQQVTISTKDRVRMEGHDWIVTALHERTDRAVTRVEVRRA